MFKPNIDEVKTKYKNYNKIPVVKEILLDTHTPISLAAAFKDSRYHVLLESVEGGKNWGRYSFLAKDPVKIYRYYFDHVEEESLNCITKHKVDPIEHINNILKNSNSPSIRDMPRLVNGLIGYFAYDSVRLMEKLPENNPDDLNLPLIYLMEYNEIFAFDHVRQSLSIIVNIDNVDVERKYNDAIKRIVEIENEINNIHIEAGMISGNTGDFEGSLDKEEYMNIVDKAKKYIYEGDIFQVVLSRRMKAKTTADPFSVYRMLRSINPSPYMFFMKMNEVCIVGSSPEMLLRKSGDIVETCPIAGTRKRVEDPDLEKIIEEELLADKKESAEHNMLVDLGRNDIGRISRPGTVFVDYYKKIQKFSHVMHIVSNVKGKIREDISAVDALMALIPAGTLSGAPKIRAMEIIEELESLRRGPYGGAAGYFSFDGNCDFCIIIRTFIFHKGHVYIQSGSGIVVDSDPEKEYEETCAKAKALLVALERTGE